MVMIEWSLSIHKNEASAGCVASRHPRAPRVGTGAALAVAAARGRGELRCHLGVTAEVSEPRNAGRKAKSGQVAPWSRGQAAGAAGLAQKANEVYVPAVTLILPDPRRTA